MAKRIDWTFIQQMYRASGLAKCAIDRLYTVAHEHKVDWKPTVSEEAIHRGFEFKKMTIMFCNFFNVF